MMSNSIDQQQRHLKVNDRTLTKQEQDDLLRSLLPACQPQEGSPANTFTHSELDDLQRAVGSIQVGLPRGSVSKATTNQVDICNLEKTFQEPRVTQESKQPPTIEHKFVGCPQDGLEDEAGDSNISPQDGTESTGSNEILLDWFAAPRFHKEYHLPRAFREKVRRGDFCQPTNAVCPGFLQCNMVVLPQGPIAFDFLLFCQRNPKACPLVEVCDVGSPYPHGVAPGADLRTDLPKYAIYRDGKLDKEVSDVTEYWPEQSVAFLIGCSFSYDGPLMDAGIPLKSAAQGKNVPMYKTALKCRPAGSLSGNMVVSMKPIPALKVSKHIEITSKYTHAHGGPVAVGSASAIGIADINKPEWGDPIDVADDEVAVFHACGVTPQSILMDSKVPFAITHSAGHMFVTDMPSDLDA